MSECSAKIIRRIGYIACGLAALAILGKIWFCYDTELAKFLGYLMGGGLLLWQIDISSRRAKSAEDTAKEMQKTTELTERGNIAERFKNAIDHLGHNSVSVRLGGIYTMHHIAWQVEDYRIRVFDILCAHIRETTTHCNYMPRKDESGALCPAIEIQNALDLLFVKDQDKEIYKECSANLENANLRGAILRRAILKKASFQGADLQDAQLVSSYLYQANLCSANLCRVTFDMADLSYCQFNHADLRSAIFGETKVELNQLAGAKTLYDAILPDEIKSRLRTSNPRLFAQPNDWEEF